MGQIAMVDETNSTVDELVDELHESDASRALKRIVRRDPQSVGASRNSAREEVRKYIDSWDMDLSEDEPFGGSFFMALWEGDVDRATRLADLDNARLMEAEFGISREEAYDRL